MDEQDDNRSKIQPDGSPPSSPRPACPPTDDSLASQLAEVLRVVRQLQEEKSDEAKKRRAWSSYVHLILIAAIAPIPFLEDTSGATVGYLAGCTTLASTLHGLSMRPWQSRWRLTLYCALTVLLLWSWLGLGKAEILELFVIIGIFFVSASTIASLLGSWLSCGILPPDLPADRSRRPSLLHLFEILTAIACLLAIARWGTTHYLGAPGALATPAFLSVYGAACSTIAVGCWGFISRWKGAANSWTGLAMLTLFQLIANSGFSIVMTITHGGWEQIQLGTEVAVMQATFCVAQVTPLAIGAAVLLRTGHIAASFLKPEPPIDLLQSHADLDT